MSGRKFGILLLIVFYLTFPRSMRLIW